MRDEGQERDKLLCISGTQSMVLEPAASALPGDLLEIHILRLNPQT